MVWILMVSRFVAVPSANSSAFQVLAAMHSITTYSISGLLLNYTLTFYSGTGKQLNLLFSYLPRVIPPQ